MNKCNAVQVHEERPDETTGETRLDRTWNQTLLFVLEVTRSYRVDGITVSPDSDTREVKYSLQNKDQIFRSAAMLFCFIDVIHWSLDSCSSTVTHSEGGGTFVLRQPAA